MLAVMAILAVMIVYPAVVLLSESLLDEDGAFTFAWYVEAYTDPRNFEAIANTLIIAGATSLFATIFGTFMAWAVVRTDMRSEEHTSELQSLMRISYAVFCLKKKKHTITDDHTHISHRQITNAT